MASTENWVNMRLLLKFISLLFATDNLLLSQRLCEVSGLEGPRAGAPARSRWTAGTGLGLMDNKPSGPLQTLNGTCMLWRPQLTRVLGKAGERSWHALRGESQTWRLFWLSSLGDVGGAWEPRF